MPTEGDLMHKDRIHAHFVRFLGLDVGVSFEGDETLTKVTLYRPDTLPDSFVGQAFEAFLNTRTGYRQQN